MSFFSSFKYRKHITYVFLGIRSSFSMILCAFYGHFIRDPVIRSFTLLVDTDTLHSLFVMNG